MTVPDEFLVASTGRLIRASAAALEVGREWAEDAARVVLSQPAVLTAFQAADTLRTLQARHQPRPYGPGSPTLVCDCGSGSFDSCIDAQMLNNNHGGSREA